jgi:hypothetical protein
MINSLADNLHKIRLYNLIVKTFSENLSESVAMINHSALLVLILSVLSSAVFAQVENDATSGNKTRDGRGLCYLKFCF